MHAYRVPLYPKPQIPFIKLRVSESSELKHPCLCPNVMPVKREKTLAGILAAQEYHKKLTFAEQRAKKTL